jgi:hypothetical protein|tara:strand:- start:2107 stop:2673 length:567 start_codon:yes stop_codon:yes gene_type:complete
MNKNSKDGYNMFRRVPTEAEQNKIESAFPTKRKAGRPKGAKNNTCGGAPAFVPTDMQREDVVMMSANGIKPMHQAESLGVSMKILNKYFKSELDYGKMRANTRVSGALYGKAMEGNVPAMIFWLKSQAGWREADRLELTGANGKQLMNLTDTDKEQRMLSVLMRAKGMKPSQKVDPVKVVYGEEPVEE